MDCVSHFCDIHRRQVVSICVCVCVHIFSLLPVMLESELVLVTALRHS